MRVASPLNKLLQKTVAYTWGSDQQQAVEDLKRKSLLVHSPILAYPNAEGTFILDTDASDTSIGAVLSHEQTGDERVVSYASSQLDPAYRRYCVTSWELLAVVRFT